MSIGDGGGASAGGTETGACAVCRRPETKRCSQCKTVWYCSPACQSKHWVDHKLNCKQARLSDKVDIVSSDKGACGRMKSSSFGLISLVPAHETSKVLHVPKKVLFPYNEFVRLFNWDKRRLQPCGLINCGNSCFANVVLQCLVCTRPLMAYLLQRNHSRGCLRKQDDWCFLCELEVHIRRASQNFIPFSPINILTKLHNIGGSLGFGRQEDAHEFMRFAIETMQSVCLDELRDQKDLDPSINETTLIHYIFGGHLQSQVICTKCNMVSNRYENMMDLMVEIQGEAESLEECLDQFTIMEWLDGENMYKCDGCNDYVKACKRLTVHQAPNILMIALKRFESGRFGKLNKRVAFPENLDLTPYMSQGGDGTDLYTLYAVVVHLDMENASYFGHYVCYIKDCYGYWNRVDDCKVVFVEVEEVLAQGAYMLLYSRRTARREPFFNPMEPARKRQLEAGFKASNHFKATGPISLRCVQLIPSLHEVPIEGKSEDICLYKDFEDEDIYDSKPSSLGSNEDEGKPSISPRLPEGISSMHSNSVSLSEISSVEVQAIEVKVMPIPKDLGNGGMNGFEPRPFGPRDFEEEKLLPMDDSEPSSSVPQYLEEGKSSISSSLAEDASSVKSMQSKSIPPAKIPSIGAQSAGCREPCISSDADICMGVGTGSPSTIEEPFQLSKYTPDDSCSIKNIVLNMAETSSGAFITTSDTVLGLSDHSRPNLVQAVAPSSPSDSADRVHMPDDVSCACKRTRTQASCWENGSRGKPKALFARGFLDNPSRKKSVGHGLETITGNLELALALAPKANGYAPGHMEPEALSNHNDTLPSSDKLSISRGFLNESYKQTANEDEIAKMESREADHPCKANHNGSAEPDSVKPRVHDSDACLEPISSNGMDILPGFGSSFIPRGFLDKAYKQLKNENKAAEGVHSCKTNCDCAAGLNYGFAEQASASH